MPNGVALHSIAWNSDEDFIACGGADGFLKVLKLEKNQSTASSGSENTQSSPASPPQESLVMNQNLEAHTGTFVIPFSPESTSLLLSLCLVELQERSSVLFGMERFEN